MLKKLLYVMLAALLSAVACVKVDTNLGQNLAPHEHRYEVFCENIPLENIRVQRVDSTYAYSNFRITVGAVKDDEFGLTVKSSAFTLVPLDSILNFGRETEFLGFFLTMSRDSLSLPVGEDPRVAQTLRVYALNSNCDINNTKEFLYTEDVKKIDQALISEEPITDYTLVYQGEDTLNMHFRPEFYNGLKAKWLAKAKENEKHEKVFKVDHFDTLSNSSYLKDFPGIYLTCDEPAASNKGRFNLFQLKLAVNTSTYVISGNYAELRFKAKYGTNTEYTDTSFIFLFGPQSIPTDAASLPIQEAFNGISHSPLHALDGMTLAADNKSYTAGSKIYLEGGAGLRPVISAKEIRDSLFRRFAKHKIKDNNKVIIDQASVAFSFKEPADFDILEQYPVIFAPMHISRYKVKDRVYGETQTIAYLDFPPITDAGVSAEDQGAVDRSNLEYSPDISFHAQHLLKMKDPSDDDLAKQDIWMFIKAPETIVTQAVSNADADYYNQLMYYSYLNSMYGGGYGGYGGYGYNNYNSYYSMMYYYSMMNSSNGSTSSVQNMADPARYYNAVLCGPDDAENHPVLRVVYSVPKDCIE